jgi:hypothetical protein
MRMAKTSRWAAFPHAAPDLGGDKMKKAWPALHAGDQEAYPDDKRAAALLKAAGKAAPKGMDAAGLATALQAAWADFHGGSFQQAFEAGEALGVIGASLPRRRRGL